MNDQPAPNLIVPAVLFEGIVGLVAIGLGGLFGYPPGQMIHWSVPSIGWGAVASLPPLLVLVLLVWFPMGPFGKLLRLLDEQVIPSFRQASLLQLAVLSLVAGLTEEALFRGLIQEAIADGVGRPLGEWVGLAAAASLFGLAHFLSLSYAVIATVMGLYLGWLWLDSGNLLVPIVAHTIYDFLALVYLVKIRHRSSGGP